MESPRSYGRAARNIRRSRSGNSLELNGKRDGMEMKQYKKRKIWQ